MSHRPGRKGAIAEASVVAHAARLGIDVYRPAFEGGRYDLVLAVGDQLLRTQVKWAERKGDVVAVRCYSSRRTRDGVMRRTYSASEVDVIVAYCASLDRCFVIPARRFEGHTDVQLRLAPCRNGQRRRVNWADDHRLEDLSWVTAGP